jgi:DNA-binding YbaB/EbfC family protein
VSEPRADQPDEGSEIIPGGLQPEAPPGGGPSGGDMPDLSQLLSQVGQMASDMQAAQAEAAAQVVEGTAGGGAVKVAITAGFDAQSVTIDRSVVDPDDTELLGDLVLAALGDALEQAKQVQAQAMGGLDLGGAAGMLGL